MAMMDDTQALVAFLPQQDLVMLLAQQGYVVDEDDTMRLTGLLTSAYQLARDRVGYGLDAIPAGYVPSYKLLLTELVLVDLSDVSPLDEASSRRNVFSKYSYLQQRSSVRSATGGGYADDSPRGGISVDEAEGVVTRLVIPEVLKSHATVPFEKGKLPPDTAYDADLVNKADRSVVTDALPTGFGASGQVVKVNPSETGLLWSDDQEGSGGGGGGLDQDTVDQRVVDGTKPEARRGGGRWTPADLPTNIFYGAPRYTFRGAWVSGTPYAVGDICEHSDEFYIASTARATTDTTTPDSDSNWMLLTAEPRTDADINSLAMEEASKAIDNQILDGAKAGAEARMPKNKLPTDTLYGNKTYRGTWSAGVYAVGDVVAYSDKFYICAVARTAANTNNPSVDTTSWFDITAMGGDELPTILSGLPSAFGTAGQYLELNAHANGWVWTERTHLEVETYTHGTIQLNRSAWGVTPLVTIPTTGDYIINFSGNLRGARRNTDPTTTWTFALKFWEIGPSTTTQIGAELLNLEFTRFANNVVYNDGISPNFTASLTAGNRLALRHRYWDAQSSQNTNVGQNNPNPNINSIVGFLERY